ncbi:hypothetical protein PGT21_002160 [Puccinia graminis f. sp. tritici]|uniref:Uncharacterized protein n=1 Tax=Puccinia graminis f. sp. tritici TaxID=56615 RepID=A0A5B0M965_PUCGR|nr:hypothetical protein PGT21_002160 [Puccinia graminis f. sp. tritici]KAA1132667.1 hypothetical protein PGTUg99_011192 [Puccinia graminis f. sp. tritici]
MSSITNDHPINSDQTLINQKTPEQDHSIQTKIQAILSSKLNIPNDLSSEKESFSHSNNQHRLKELNQSIGESIQKVLIEFYPNGYKFMICTQVIENKGQAGRAGLVSHWDQANDKVYNEVWSNDFVIGTVTAFVIKVAY